jgi:hypothetical protein
MILLSASAFAAETPDETADRFAIARTLPALNAPDPTALFAANSTAALELQRLRAPHPKAFRITGTSDLPSVKISPAVWGEAELHIPIEFPLDGRNIAFISPDVAVVEAGYSFEEDGALRRLPLLITMKRESGVWKIASLKALAPINQ